MRLGSSMIVLVGFTLSFFARSTSLRWGALRWASKRVAYWRLELAEGVVDLAIRLAGFVRSPFPPR